MVVDKLYEFMFHHQIFLQLPYNIFISISKIFEKSDTDMDLLDLALETEISTYSTVSWKALNAFIKTTFYI